MNTEEQVREAATGTVIEEYQLYVFHSGGVVDIHENFDAWAWADERHNRREAIRSAAAKESYDEDSEELWFHFESLEEARAAKARILDLQLPCELAVWISTRIEIE